MAQDEDTKSDGQTVSGKENEQEGVARNAKKTPTTQRQVNGSSLSVATASDYGEENDKNPINPQTKEEDIKPVEEEVCSVEPLVANGNDSSTTYVTPARANSSQKDLRQQFRLLQSQELIRRILQSTGVLPNNLAQKTSPAGRSPAKSEDKQENVVIEKKGQDKLISIQQNPISESLKKADTHEQTPKHFCKNSLESEISENRKEKKTEDKKEMESDTSFVCSVCSCRPDDHGDLKDRDLNTPVESYSIRPIEQEPKMSSTKQTTKTPVAPTSKVKNTGSPNVEELSERLHQQPSHEMLDEILKLLQNQAKQMHTVEREKDENANTVQKIVKKPPEVMQQTNVMMPLESLLDDDSLIEDDWKQEQQQKYLMTRTRPNLREKHSRQLTDMKNYYENEIGKLRDQLENLRGSLSSLQEAIPMKMLESANQKLDSRCQLMEQINNELKEKCQKLEHTVEELEKSSQGVRQNNEALEMKCIFLQKSLQDGDSKRSKLQNMNKVLESKIHHFTKVNEVNSKNTKQLEEVNKTFEKACKELEQSNEKLEVRYRKCKEENLQLSADMRDLQGSLQTCRQHAEEQEALVATLENEKNDWALKLDLAQKTAKGAQNRYEEIKIETVEQETMLQKMEEQMGIMTMSCENAAKAKSELEKNAERDRELLKRLLTEYDALVKENQKLKGVMGSMTNRFDTSQDDINDLRGTISTLIHRNASLEESLKETLSRSIKSTPETMPGPRKTWDSPTMLKAGQQLIQPSLSSFDSIYDGRGTSTDNLLVEEGHFSVNEIPQKDQPSTPPSVKFEIPWERPKSSTPNTTKRNLEQSYNKSTNSPNNLVVKKSDLVTRFDVVFEDSQSGTEIKRSHTGRTSRAQGESPTSIFVSNSAPDINESSSGRLVSNAAEAALTALKSGRVLTQADWEGRTPKSARARRKKSGEKNKARQTKSASSDEKSDREADVTKLDRRLSSLTEEKLRLESTLSRIPTHRVTKRSRDDKDFLEKRLDEVIQDIGSVRMQLRKYHAL